MVKDQFKNREGMVCEVKNYHSDAITFTCLGDDKLQAMTRAEFFETFSRIYIPRKATFDWLDVGDDVDAWDNGQYWNGWACPAFSYENALKIQRYLPNLSYDPARDAFVSPDNGCGEEESFTAITIETASGPQKAYPVGAGSWTWDWAEDDEADEGGPSNESASH